MQIMVHILLISLLKTNNS